MSKRILIMAGGTGGHVFPALAIAGELKKRGYEILWLGTRGRMEEKLVPKSGFPIEYIDVRGIRRNGLKAKLSAPLMVCNAVRQALQVMKSFKPDAVLGMGGYASGPGGVAARLCGIPLALHEQNAAAGLTNRLLSKLATVIMLGFPGAFTGDRVRIVGNPVRNDILALYRRERDANNEKMRVLVIGGSLGAQALNELVPKAISLLDKNILSVTHQCGGGHVEATQHAYEGCGADHEIREFITDMSAAYAEHDLIICRAGASTVAETACAGIPAIFVPLPTAVDDHQTKNAMFSVGHKAALLCPQKDLKPESLAELLKDLALHRDRLKAMSEAAYDCAVTDATQRAADLIDGIAASRS